MTEADRKVGNGVAEYLRLKDIEFRWPAWLILGRTVVLGEGLLLVVGNDECLRLDRDCDGFPELSVTLRSRRGRAVFQLHRNALVDIHPEFDFEQRGNEATLRSSNGNIILNIAYYPPELIQIRRVKLMGCGIDPIDIDSRNAFPVVRERIVGGDLAALSGPIVLMGKDRMQIRNGSLISPMIDQNVFDHLIEEGAIEDLLKKRFHDEQLVEALAMARRRGQTQ